MFLPEGQAKGFLVRPIYKLHRQKCLAEDCEVTTSAYERVSTKIAYAWPSGWSVFTQATWYPGNLYSEAAFNITGDAVHAGSSVSMSARCRDLPSWLGSPIECQRPNRCLGKASKNENGSLFALAIALLASVTCAKAHDIWITIERTGGECRAVVNYGHPHAPPSRSCR